MGASAFLKSVYFRAFEINVKTIALRKYLYQFGHAIWWSTMSMPVFTFLEEYDFSGKTILPFSSNGGILFWDSISDLSKTARGAYVGQGFEYEYSGGRGLSDNLNEWLTSNGIGAR